ncbi:hypothetical protein [Marinobacterium nitratireducens]|uniref:hypothetical protein n=1 Tax=Marinobacterium nitratireducens TaxID=518897 RepID=UPI00166E82E9|nr:hypothetical protein [Marinobacterium nitratireducens]
MAVILSLRRVIAGAENFPAVQVQVKVTVAAATFEQLAVFHLAEGYEIRVWSCLGRHSLAWGAGSFHDGASCKGWILAGVAGLRTGFAA